MTLVAGHTTIRIPVLESGGLRMRAPRPSDFDAYAEFCGSARSASVGGPYTRTQAMHRFVGLLGHWGFYGYGRWMVADARTDAPLGVVGLMNEEDWPEPEIAWSVFAEAEGRGVAYEAALIARRYAYEELGWSTVISCTTPDNTRSEALARRLGAVEDGTFEHPEHGDLKIWRHVSAKDLAA